MRHTFICKHTENNESSFNIVSSTVISVYHLLIIGTRLNMVGVALNGRRKAPSAWKGFHAGFAIQSVVPAP